MNLDSSKENHTSEVCLWQKYNFIPEIFIIIGVFKYMESNIPLSTSN